MKKIIYAVTLLISATTITAKTARVIVKKTPAIYRQDIEHSNLFYKKTTTAQEAREPKEHVLLGIDMNGVLFDKNMRCIPTIMNEIRKKKGVLYLIRLILASKKLNNERTVTVDGHKIKRCWDAVLTEHENPSDPLSHFVEDMRMATARVNVLNHQVSHLIYGLHLSGHQSYILSNMGANVLSTLVKHLEKHAPEKQHISQEEYSYLLSFLKNKKRSFISAAQNHWVIKPSPEAYASFLNKNKQVKGKRIFIDDKLENILAALENGFDFAILYKNPANLDKLLFEVLHLKR